MIALVDCNNFYASCERVFRPDLIGKPIVILSNNDGCVIARSNEAKTAGVPMGAPAFKFKQLFEQQKINVFSANFALYGDMSQRIMDILCQYAPQTEIYSIDEAFLKLHGFTHFNLQNYGHLIQSKVIKYTGIPVSIGIANTKSLAKVANKIAKNFPQKTNNSYVIDTEEKRIKALKWLKITDVWGIGRQHAKKLNTIGVKTAYDFTQLNDTYINKNLSIVELRLKKDLQGIPTLALEEVAAKKSIATTRTFEENYSNINQLKERITSFAVSCAEKLRQQKSCCSAIIVFLQTNFYRKDLPQYNKKILMQLPFATNSSLELVKFANQALENIFKPNFYYKKAGVIVMDITNELHTQLNFFEQKNAKHIPLMKAIDNINATFGQQKVKLGQQDFNSVWKMKQEKLSPQYTTNIKHIITIHAQ
ncbi:MAG: Y-family DNA polymerase [Sphingobacteriales bacterium]|nr:MAG: Y-family DNA polymerase [Sphingobacteriales bacterium]